LGTGVSVTILPKEVVNPADLTGVTIQARCAIGTSMLLKKAMMRLFIGNMELSRRQGVPPGLLIGGT